VRSRFLDPAPPVAFAHRGYSPTGAENSMAAFAAAVALGYQYVETDARVTADAVAVAFHDDRLDRVTDRRGRLDRLPWDEVARARIRGTDAVPRLDELLGEWPQLRVNIDVKSGPALAAAVDAITRTRAQDRVCLAAFSDVRLRRIRALVGPDVCTALGPGEVALLLAASRSGRHVGPALTRTLSGRAAQLPLRAAGLPLATSAVLDTAHQAGLAVHVWTVNDRTRMSALLDLGVDGIMTDQAETLRDVLTARAAWPFDGPPAVASEPVDRPDRAADGPAGGGPNSP
jgi:glycerophosphoryl diester phosphodiesterase